MDGQIECRCHSASFDLATGRPTAPPATRPITTDHLEEDGRDALVAITPWPASTPRAQELPHTGIWQPPDLGDTMRGYTTNKDDLKRLRRIEGAPQLGPLVSMPGLTLWRRVAPQVAPHVACGTEESRATEAGESFGA